MVTSVELIPDTDRDSKYQIFIHDLRLLASIGIHPEEKINRQSVLISVVLDVVYQDAVLNDDLSSVICYEAIVTRLKQLVEHGHINLIETLAARIAEICLADSRVERVRVRVEKPDILPAAKGVGITLIQQRKKTYKTFISPKTQQ